MRQCLQFYFWRKLSQGRNSGTLIVIQTLGLVAGDLDT